MRLVATGPAPDRLADFTPGLAADVKALEVGIDDGWLDTHPILKQLYSPSRLGLVAFRGGTAVGWLLYRNFHLHSDVLRVAVAEPFRRQGIGRTLMGRFIERFESTGRDYIEVLVSEMNLPAQLFLRSCGFYAAEIIHPKSADERDRYRFLRAHGGE